jgi:hypothetical protein
VLVVISNILSKQALKILVGVIRHELVSGVVTIGVVSPWTGVNGEGLSLGLIILGGLRPSVEVDGSGLPLEVDGTGLPLEVDGSGLPLEVDGSGLPLVFFTMGDPRPSVWVDIDELLVEGPGLGVVPPLGVRGL